MKVMPSGGKILSLCQTFLSSDELYIFALAIFSINLFQFKYCCQSLLLDGEEHRNQSKGGADVIFIILKAFRTDSSKNQRDVCEVAELSQSKIPPAAPCP